MAYCQTKFPRNHPTIERHSKIVIDMFQRESANKVYAQILRQHKLKFSTKLKTRTHIGATKYIYFVQDNEIHLPK